MPLSRSNRQSALAPTPRLSMYGIAALGVSLLLAGCNAASVQSAADGPVIQGVALQGRTFGGQQPVSGAVVQLYAVGNSGVASAANPLISSTVKTDASGAFNISGDYTCASGTQVYLTATGGDPGLGTTNGQIALMAALGNCGSLNRNTIINVNEITTVASVAALLGYMTDVTKVGSASGDSGLATAFTRVPLLANTATGAVAPATQTQWNYTTQPTNLITLADSVAACINSAGGLAGTSTVCGSLLTDATPPGGKAPTNTVAAIVDILNNPTQNVGAIYDLAGPTSPFQPTLHPAPVNWSLGLYAPAPAVSFSGYTATMTVASPAVQIRYTLDGSTPTTSSTLYSGPVAVPIAAGTTVTVNAIGVDAKNVTSSVTSESVQRPAVPTPTISVNGTTVTISAASPAVQERYTLDGSTPTTSSTLYSGPFTVSPGTGLSTTIKAIAVDAQGSTGGVASQTVYGAQRACTHLQRHASRQHRCKRAEHVHR